MPPLPEGAYPFEVKHWGRLGRFYAWRAAPRVWSTDHGDSLGSFVDRFLFERAVRSALHQACRWGDDGWLVSDPGSGIVG